MKSIKFILESGLSIIVSECTTNLLVVHACHVPDVIESHLSPLPVLHEHRGCETQRRQIQFVVLHKLVPLAHFSIDLIIKRIVMEHYHDYYAINGWKIAQRVSLAKEMWRFWLKLKGTSKA